MSRGSSTQSWELVDEASAAAGRDVAHLLLHADADELKQTRNSQLATFVASLVVLDAVERLGVEPAVYAGHSLGEYTRPRRRRCRRRSTTGVRLVAERGDAMQAAGTEHAGDDGRGAGARRRQGRRSRANGIDGDVWVANYNAPGQVVIAGRPRCDRRRGRRGQGRWAPSG